MPLGLDVSGALHGALARFEPIIDRLLRTTGFGVVVSEQLRLDHVGKPRLQDIGNARMMLLASALQQRLISRVADQRMLEFVGHAPGNTPPIDESGNLKTGQCCLQAFLVQRHHCSQNIVRERTPNDGGNLRDFLDWPEVVEARQQRSLDGGWNGEPRQSAVRTASRGFQHGLGYFLDEEWHSVSPRSNLIDDIGGRRQWFGGFPCPPNARPSPPNGWGKENQIPVGGTP